MAAVLLQDSEYYNSLVWIMENDPVDLDLTFSVEEDYFGEVSEIPASDTTSQNVRSSPWFRLWLNEKEFLCNSLINIVNNMS